MPLHITNSTGTAMAKPQYSMLGSGSLETLDDVQDNIGEQPVPLPMHTVVSMNTAVSTLCQAVDGVGAQWDAALGCQSMPHPGVLPCQQAGADMPSPCAMLERYLHPVDGLCVDGAVEGSMMEAHTSTSTGLMQQAFVSIMAMDRMASSAAESQTSVGEPSKQSAE